MTDRQIDLLMRDFGVAIGAPDMALDEQDFLAITTDEGFVVNLDYFEDDKALVVYTTAGDIPEEHRFDLYEEMLKANLFWNTTAGATLCIDPEGESALVTAHIAEATLDAPMLVTFVTNICRVAAMWNARLRELVEDLETTDDAPEPGPGDAAQFA
ncbi:MAG: type III secretion system chaperone [Planctomycetota bacterium]